MCWAVDCVNTHIGPSFAKLHPARGSLTAATSGPFVRSLVARYTFADWVVHICSITFEPELDIVRVDVFVGLFVGCDCFG